MEDPKKPTTQKPSALVVMATRLNVEPERMKQTLKDTVFKDARNDSELMALVVVANEYGLNPLLREIYAFPAKGGGIVPVVSVDGWIKMVNRQKALDGLDFNMQFSDDGKPYACTCSIYVKGRRHPIRVSEYYDECFRKTEAWEKMPRRMLRHKSLIQAGRVAFGFSGVQDEDEARDTVNSVIDIKTEPIPKFVPTKEEKVLPDKKPTPLEQIRKDLKAFSISEKEFCRGLLALGYVEGDILSLAELTPSTMTQVADATVEKLLKELDVMNGAGGSPPSPYDTLDEKQEVLELERRPRK